MATSTFGALRKAAPQPRMSNDESTPIVRALSLVQDLSLHSAIIALHVPCRKEKRDRPYFLAEIPEFFEFARFRLEHLPISLLEIVSI